MKARTSGVVSNAEGKWKKDIGTLVDQSLGCKTLLRRLQFWH